MLKSAVRLIDSLCTHAQLNWWGETNALIVFLFHTIYLDQEEAKSDLVDPALGVTLGEFRKLVQYFTQRDYNFVTPEQVLRGLPLGRHCLITFDDGYYNNRRVLPVLEEFGAPMLVFVSSRHVLENRGYWWDVMYRERTRQGKSPAEIAREVATFKDKRHDVIEGTIRDEFGKDVFRPVGELDRPLTPNELQAFAAHELVHIGNHTADHALLTNYDAEGVRQQVSQAQQDLTEITGEVPEIISYPNGNFNDAISQISQEAGLRMGITTRPHKNRLPLSTAGLLPMQLGRFMPDASQPMQEQCLSIRSDIRLARRLREFCKLS